MAFVPAPGHHMDAAGAITMEKDFLEEFDAYYGSPGSPIVLNEKGNPLTPFSGDMLLNEEDNLTLHPPPSTTNNQICPPHQDSIQVQNQICFNASTLDCNNINNDHIMGIVNNIMVENNHQHQSVNFSIAAAASSSSSSSVAANNRPVNMFTNNDCPALALDASGDVINVTYTLPDQPPVAYVAPSMSNNNNNNNLIEFNTEEYSPEYPSYGTVDGIKGAPLFLDEDTKNKCSAWYVPTSIETLERIKDVKIQQIINRLMINYFENALIQNKFPQLTFSLFKSRFMRYLLHNKIYSREKLLESYVNSLLQDVSILFCNGIYAASVGLFILQTKVRNCTEEVKETVYHRNYLLMKILFEIISKDISKLKEFCERKKKEKEKPKSVKIKKTLIVEFYNFIKEEYLIIQKSRNDVINSYWRSVDTENVSKTIHIYMKYLFFCDIKEFLNPNEVNFLVSLLYSIIGDQIYVMYRKNVNYEILLDKKLTQINETLSAVQTILPDSLDKYVVETAVSDNTSCVVDMCPGTPCLDENNVHEESESLTNNHQEANIHSVNFNKQQTSPFMQNVNLLLTASIETDKQSTCQIESIEQQLVNNNKEKEVINEIGKNFKNLKITREESMNKHVKKQKIKNTEVKIQAELHGQTQNVSALPENFHQPITLNEKDKNQIIEKHLEVKNHLKDKNQIIEKHSEDKNQIIQMDPKDKNQIIEMDPKDKNQIIEMDPNDKNQIIEMDLKDKNQIIETHSKDKNPIIENHLKDKKQIKNKNINEDKRGNANDDDGGDDNDDDDNNDSNSSSSDSDSDSSSSSSSSSDSEDDNNQEKNKNSRKISLKSAIDSNKIQSNGRVLEFFDNDDNNEQSAIHLKVAEQIFNSTNSETELNEKENNEEDDDDEDNDNDDDDDDDEEEEEETDKDDGFSDESSTYSSDDESNSNNKDDEIVFSHFKRQTQMFQRQGKSHEENEILEKFAILNQVPLDSKILFNNLENLDCSMETKFNLDYKELLLLLYGQLESYLICNKYIYKQFEKKLSKRASKSGRLSINYDTVTMGKSNIDSNEYDVYKSRHSTSYTLIRSIFNNMYNIKPNNKSKELRFVSTDNGNMLAECMMHSIDIKNDPISYYNIDGVKHGTKKSSKNVAPFGFGVVPTNFVPQAGHIASEFLDIKSTNVYEGLCEMVYLNCFSLFKRCPNNKEIFINERQAGLKKITPDITKQARKEHPKAKFSCISTPKDMAIYFMKLKGGSEYNALGKNKLTDDIYAASEFNITLVLLSLSIKTILQYKTAEVVNKDDTYLRDFYLNAFHILSTLKYIKETTKGKILYLENTNEIYIRTKVRALIDCFLGFMFNVKHEPKNIDENIHKNKKLVQLLAYWLGIFPYRSVFTIFHALVREYYKIDNGFFSRGYNLTRYYTQLSTKPNYDPVQVTGKRKKKVKRISVPQRFDIINDNTPVFIFKEEKKDDESVNIKVVGIHLSFTAGSLEAVAYDFIAKHFATVMRLCNLRLDSSCGANASLGELDSRRIVDHYCRFWSFIKVICDLVLYDILKNYLALFQENATANTLAANFVSPDWILGSGIMERCCALFFGRQADQHIKTYAYFTSFIKPNIDVIDKYLLCKLKAQHNMDLDENTMPSLGVLVMFVANQIFSQLVCGEVAENYNHIVENLSDEVTKKKYFEAGDDYRTLYGEKKYIDSEMRTATTNFVHTTFKKLQEAFDTFLMNSIKNPKLISFFIANASNCHYLKEDEEMADRSGHEKTDEPFNYEDIEMSANYYRVSDNYPINNLLKNMKSSLIKIWTKETSKETRLAKNILNENIKQFSQFQSSNDKLRSPPKSTLKRASTSGKAGPKEKKSRKKIDLTNPNEDITSEVLEYETYADADIDDDDDDDNDNNNDNVSTNNNDNKKINKLNSLNKIDKSMLIAQTLNNKFAAEIIKKQNLKLLNSNEIPESEKHLKRKKSIKKDDGLKKICKEEERKAQLIMETQTLSDKYTKQDSKYLRLISVYDKEATDGIIEEKKMGRVCVCKICNINNTTALLVLDEFRYVHMCHECYVYLNEEKGGEKIEDVKKALVERLDMNMTKPIFYYDNAPSSRLPPKSCAQRGYNVCLKKPKKIRKPTKSGAERKPRKKKDKDVITNQIKRKSMTRLEKEEEEESRYKSKKYILDSSSSSDSDDPIKGEDDRSKIGNDSTSNNEIGSSVSDKTMVKDKIKLIKLMDKAMGNQKKRRCSNTIAPNDRNNN